MLRKVYDHFKEKYHLGTKMADNQLVLSSAGYSFSHEIDTRVLRGEFRTTEDMANATASKKVEIKTKINTHTHGIYLMHSVDEIKTITSIPAQKVKNILQRLFRIGKKTKFKFVALDTSDFYAFVINNIKILKQDFREIMAQESSKQLTFLDQAKTATFTIPEQELYKFSTVKKIKPMEKNVYAGYTNEFVTSETRKSTPERLFEQFCERTDAVEWVYKNGDAGQQYFSVVYQDGFSGKQWLFYPDYIVKLTNGEVWIIETKGGMQGGFTKEATYYLSLTDLCASLAEGMELATLSYSKFVDTIISQQQEFAKMSESVINHQALEDFEYLASLSAEDVGTIVSNMILLLQNTDAYYDKPESAKLNPPSTIQNSVNMVK
jgi:type III restriction enzyme